MKDIGIILFGFIGFGMLTNNFYLSLYVFMGICVLAALYGFIFKKTYQ